MPAPQTNGRFTDQSLKALPASVVIKAVGSPVAIGSKIDFPVATFPRDSQKGFKAGGGPQLIPLFSTLSSVQQSLGKQQWRET